jgi:hypothetical protein
MRRYFVVLSVGLNLVLGFFLFREKNKLPLERVVFEHQPIRAEATKTKNELPPASLSPKDIKVSDSTSDHLSEEVSQRIEEAGEKVQQDRLEFLLERLDLGQSDLDQIEKIKSRYFHKLQKILGTEKKGELGVDQRRRWLELEADRDREFVALLGKVKWDKFKKFKNNYNEKNFDQQTDDNSIVVPMDI